ncbi:hypothetical protein FIU87_02510 [Bacillus sp. THAF10]|nr:hypothetical protein FIU87_02510 [Bacillus sp. THAF10]
MVECWALFEKKMWNWPTIGLFCAVLTENFDLRTLCGGFLVVGGVYIGRNFNYLVDVG